MPDDPEIAVVVGAYRRSEFLPAAVQSVLAQTIPRAAFEVLVVTDQDDPNLRRGLERSGVAVRTDPEPRIGTWLLAAIRETRAPLVALLDDDDQFEPDRLAAALAAFRTHPEVGFYRNRVVVVDGAGATVPTDRWNRLELDPSFDRTGPLLVPAGDRARSLDLCRAGATFSFNASTMIVRRELLEGDTAAAFAESQLPDLALAVLAMTSPCAMYLDDRRRTRYRSALGSATHRVDWLGVAAESHARLGAHAERRGFPELASWLGERAVHFDRMHRGESVVESVRSASSRRAVADGAIEYLRFLGRHPREWSTELSVWAAPLYAGGYVLAPGLARRLAVARPTADRS
jgi:Glycosyl transferase family 2